MSVTPPPTDLKRRGRGLDNYKGAAVKKEAKLPKRGVQENRGGRMWG